MPILTQSNGQLPKLEKEDEPYISFSTPAHKGYGLRRSSQKHSVPKRYQNATLSLPLLQPHHAKKPVHIKYLPFELQLQYNENMELKDQL